ncbi:MAG: DNA-binding response regulator [Verrucomicrobiales bacterium]|nr:DNA-binding response regulator [Verrucomicrobiales bacterium]MDB6131741.1 DNA-binding response regulator [Verrucomicrobiales bacterium]
MNKILVLDTKLFMLRLLQHHLERAGYEMVQARNGEDALRAVQLNQFSMVLLDDSSRELFDPVIALLRMTQKHIPVIRMSEIPPGMLLPRSNENEIVLTKPFSPTQLVSEVRRLMPASI